MLKSAPDAVLCTYTRTARACQTRALTQGLVRELNETIPQADSHLDDDEEMEAEGIVRDEAVLQVGKDGGQPVGPQGHNCTGQSVDP